MFTPSSTRSMLAAGALGASLALTGSVAFGAMPVSSQDQTFATKAAQGGMAEVAAGKLALQNGSSPAVKTFAERMIHDHGMANQKLMTIAQSQGITLPGSIDPTDAAQQQKLESMKGSSFDSAYLQGQEADHEKTIALFQQEISAGKDPQLVAFAKSTLPTIESHLAMDKQDLASMSNSMKSGM